MKIGIYHPFGDFPDNYSLSHVAKEQMLMIMEHGHECYFYTADRFNGEVPAGVNVINCLPTGGTDKDILTAITNNGITDMDAVFTHDVTYLNAYYPHDSAIRYITDNYDRPKWFHWSHSAPNPKESKKPMKNSTYIGLNYKDLPLVAKQFGVPLGKCRVVYNPRSPDMFFKWTEFTKALVKKYNLLDMDVLITYPLDTGRFKDKGGFKVIKLVQHLNKISMGDYGGTVKAKVVFVNAAANDKNRTRMAKHWAEEYKDVAIFTSVEQPSFSTCVPNEIVREFMQISNVLPLLSNSEGCSTIMLEAGLCKNLFVLNEDFEPMIEFANVDEAHRMKVCSLRQITAYQPNEDAYYKDHAQIIWDILQHDKINRWNRKVLKEFNRDWIWENQLYPLLE